MCEKGFAEIEIVRIDSIMMMIMRRERIEGCIMYCLSRWARSRSFLERES